MILASTCDRLGKNTVLGAIMALGSPCWLVEPPVAPHPDDVRVLQARHGRVLVVALPVTVIRVVLFVGGLDHRLRESAGKSMEGWMA